MSRTFRLAAILAALAGPAAAADTWRPIFNGRDLEGWVPKVNHRPLGENWRDTFRVENGVLRVAYDRYDVFKDEFAHLIYRTPLSHYRLRLEYRIVGPAVPGAPAWAVRNSGVMLHGQPPETMALDQRFPVSIEAQFLAAAPDAPPGQTRPTGNVCTPGVTVSIGGVPLQAHCRNSSSKTYPEGEWVRFEVEVRGARLIRHTVNGEVVMEYGDVRLAPEEFGEFAADPKLLPARSGAPLGSGYISLQGEGHPVEFRKIELLELR
ncbi:DUF1080 domain-containing protein [Phenylobacterium sp.]|uniref:3-keto-disaccharide hydrolase n=1 Tax=Phenylobacterium sp. TaxID=1871053 RepID=UPI0028117D82|nr:DUF1080 domain-containing protein [Phenylobacterium sp.]